MTSSSFLSCLRSLLLSFSINFLSSFFFLSSSILASIAFLRSSLILWDSSACFAFLSSSCCLIRRSDFSAYLLRLSSISFFWTFRFFTRSLACFFTCSFSCSFSLRFRAPSSTLSPLISSIYLSSFFNSSRICRFSSSICLSREGCWDPFRLFTLLSCFECSYLYSEFLSSLGSSYSDLMI